MELPGRIRNEIQRVVRSANARTRIAAGTAVLLGAVVSCGWVIRSSTGHLVPVAQTADWNQDELTAVRAEISESGLPEPLERDGQLLVPEADRERYGDVIGEHVGEPGTWAEAWEEANSRLSHFSLSTEREDVREISRAKLTSRLLNELPGVEQADVVWDEERQPGWNRPPLVRATVYLKPRPEHRITLQTVHAVRLAVAGGKAYLDPENVVVIDLSRMVAFDRAALGADFATRYGQITCLTEEYRQRAEDAVAHIPGASVDVAVEPIGNSGFGDTDVTVPPAQSEPAGTRGVSFPGGGFQQERPNTGLEIPSEPLLKQPQVVTESGHAAIPTSGDVGFEESQTRHNVLVSISIPSSHYLQIATTRDLLPAATQEEASRVLAAIEQQVISDIRSRLRGVQTQIASVNARQTVVVESIDAGPIPRELLAAAAAPPVTASFLSRSRAALIAVTVLMTCWVTWAIIRQFVSRSESPQPSFAGGDVGHPAQGHGPAADRASADASELPAEGSAEILNADRNGIVVQQVLPEGPRPIQVGTENEQRSASDPERARDESHDVTTRRQTPDAEPWDIDELAGLPDAQLRRLVRSVAIDTWPAALSPAAPSTRRRLLSALPDGEAEQLREVLRNVRPIRLDDIDLAQREVQTALSGC